MLVDDESRPGLTFQTPSKPSKVVGVTLAAPYIIPGPQGQVVLTFGVFLEDTIKAARIKLGIQIVSARSASMSMMVDVICRWRREDAEGTRFGCCMRSTRPWSLLPTGRERR
jgi:hypothetical protein